MPGFLFGYSLFQVVAIRDFLQDMFLEMADGSAEVPENVEHINLNVRLGEGSFYPFE